MTVNLLPDHAGDESEAKPGDAGEDSRRNDDSEEVPEPANERSVRELIRQETPRERCGTDESREESKICSNILDGRSPEMVELGENPEPPEGSPRPNLESVPAPRLLLWTSGKSIREVTMTRFERAARGGAAALVLAATACSNNSSLGDILGGVLGGGSGGSQVSGSVAGVNTRLQQIGVQQSNGQTVTLNYDNNTQVVYQNQNYPVTSLEYGDQVTARVSSSNNTSSGYYTDMIQVNQSVSTNTGTTGSVQAFEGTVRAIDRTNGYFSISSNNYGTLTVSMPYNPRSTDLNRFNSLRTGDFVRINGVLLNNSRVELRQFY